MPNSPSHAEQEIQNLLDYLSTSGLALYPRPVQRNNGLVSWQPNSRSIPFLPERSHHSLELYRHWVSTGHFSAIMYDGSLLQLTYEFAKNIPILHRLALVPCPARVDSELLEVFPLAEVVEEALADPANIRLESTIRFDFDVAAAMPGHPAAHMTINQSGCRVPCVTPMRLGTFVRFAFEHFYPDDWPYHPFLHNMTAGGLGKRTLTDAESANVHISWAV